MRGIEKLGARLRRMAHHVAAMRTTATRRATTVSLQMSRLLANHPPTARRVAAAACALGTVAGVAGWNSSGPPSHRTTVAAQTNAQTAAAQSVAAPSVAAQSVAAQSVAAPSVAAQSVAAQSVAAPPAAGPRTAVLRAGQDRAQSAPAGGELANQDRAAQNRAPRGLFAGLRVGQAIAVKEAGGRFELTYYEDVPLGPVGPRIAELGPDYVVIDDGVGVSETRIPVYSIKAIVRFKALRAR